MRRLRIDATSDQRDAAAAYIKLIRAAESVTDRIHRELDERNLTFTQFSALEVLYSFGTVSLSDLGRKMLKNKSSANLTGVVDRLEERGFVRRSKVPEDRRLIMVSLTDEGEALMNGLMPPHLEIMAKEFGVLTSDEVVQLSRLCRILGLGHGDIDA